MSTKRYQTPVLLTVAIMAVFWAYTIVDALIREFGGDVTYRNRDEPD